MQSTSTRWDAAENKPIETMAKGTMPKPQPEQAHSTRRTKQKYKL